MNRWFNFKKGVRTGIPIFLGYLAISFTFGIAAKKAGLNIFQAVIMSFTNLTSAGQFAALDIITSSGSFFVLAFVQFIINLRYCLMSSALSQKLSEKLSLKHRLLISYGVTDEIFGVYSVFPGILNPFYCYGLIAIAVPGWTLGTFLGVLSGSLLPAKFVSALGVALYGMFIAIIIPPARKNFKIAGIVIVSMIMSAAFTYLPVLKNISSGIRIIILTVVIAGIAAVIFPVKEDATEEGAQE